MASRTLLEWAKDVARNCAIMRTEPPYTSTKELSDMIETQILVEERAQMRAAQILGLERTNQMWVEKDWEDHPGGPR